MAILSEGVREILRTSKNYREKKTKNYREKKTKKKFQLLVEIVRLPKKVLKKLSANKNTKFNL